MLTTKDNYNFLIEWIEFQDDYILEDDAEMTWIIDQSQSVFALNDLPMIDSAPSETNQSISSSADQEITSAPIESDIQSAVPLITSTNTIEDNNDTSTLFYDFGMDIHIDAGEHHSPGHPGGGGGGGGGKEPSGPEIDLFTVVLHEFGHSLGLGHSDPNDGIPSIMDSFYTGPVAGLFPADIQAIQALYPESGAALPRTWSDLDNDGIYDITYSFTPDGANIRSVGKNALNKTLDNAFGETDEWQDIFRDALDLWAQASTLDNDTDGDLVNNVELNFIEVNDTGLPFNYDGSAQNDPNSGDIRIAAHRFDGSEGILAHAYLPPPNSLTAAGDVHLDKAENWSDLSSTALLTDDMLL